MCALAVPSVGEFGADYGILWHIVHVTTGTPSAPNKARSPSDVVALAPLPPPAQRDALTLTHNRPTFVNLKTWTRLHGAYWPRDWVFLTRLLSFL